MINLILFGPPGSGKGTQAIKLVEKYNLLHISTGDLFRYEMGNDTPLGKKAKSFMAKGELVPDEITIGMLRNKVVSTPSPAGYIFDGFPRNIIQCEALDETLLTKGFAINYLLMLEVDTEEVVKRILNRGKTSNRADDLNEGIIRKRFNIYEKETSPVFNYYKNKGVAKKINGVGSIDDIFGRLCTELG